ncbi:MAG: carbamoyltransferase [Myxococcales bacterium]|nr:carbamoyltransferase [Myxococcales bacterium]
MKILGLSAYYHDSAACLLRDGRIVAAAQEERFSRQKHDAGFPSRAIDYCLGEAGIGRDEIDIVAFYEKPFLKFERILQTQIGYAPWALPAFLRAMPIWIKEKLWLKAELQSRLDFEGRIIFPEHHQSHAASAYFASPFDDAAIITIDGVGEWTTTAIGRGSGNELRLEREIHFPHSLGLLYSAFTQYLGFEVNSGEYKVMGLAPYGEPRFVETIRRELIDVGGDGGFRLNMRYFGYASGLRMINSRFEALFGRPARRSADELEPFHMDLARSLQAVIDETMLALAYHAQRLTAAKNLVLAGGVALNCVANGRVLREGPFEGLFVQPASGDAGGALGAALYVWHQVLGNALEPAPEGDDRQAGSLLGPQFDAAAIAAFLDAEGIEYQRPENLEARVAELLAKEQVVGWFQGRMEFGPRALGNRSILGDPRAPRMQETMNLKIKFRESFRPFAPSVLESEASRYFEIDRPSPYMLVTAPVHAQMRRAVDAEDAAKRGLALLAVMRSEIPAVTHVDWSARLQTVSERHNPRFHRLLAAFFETQGCPVLVNTSFNVRGEPIVCTPQDAYRCFQRTGIDALVLGDFLLEKAAMPASEGVRGALDERRPKARLLEELRAEIREIDGSPRALRQFGALIGVVSIALTGLFATRPFSALAWSAIGLGGAALACAVLRPAALRWPHRLWMSIGLVLGAIVSRVLLTVLYLVLITPMGLVARLVGRPFLDRRFRVDGERYWREREGAQSEADRQF